MDPNDRQLEASRTSGQEKSDTRKMPVDFQECQSYLFMVETAINEGDTDRFLQISPSKLQQYTWGYGCLIALVMLLKKVIDLKNNPHNESRQREAAKMLHAAISLGYHHAARERISCTESLPGCELFRILLDDSNINLNVVKILYMLGMLTGKDLRKLQDLVIGYDRRFITVNAQLLEDFGAVEPPACNRFLDSYVKNRFYESDERGKVMKFIDEANSSPRTLRDLAATAVSGIVGYGLNREKRLRSLPVPRDLLHNLMYRDAVRLVYTF